MFSCCCSPRKRKPRVQVVVDDEESRLLGPQAEIDVQVPEQEEETLRVGPGRDREEVERMMERSRRLRERLDGIVRSKESKMVNIHRHYCDYSVSSSQSHSNSRARE
ncbi:hypothetical protein K435DRAFT_844109 [Dendrothele bispora CBS 962.96]|uniref:Uncharacterized protein n=1 Tax=Dendrothele bispora (strain CBS 962.96) TaxID=1314807 RepID=A0A4S8L3X2_DENBC|nr:hypothetical protein K435DRAFT_844109 [Dendrothele bispora CBS 962.96]